MFLYFSGKLLSGHWWRKSVLISVLIRSLGPFVLLCGDYFPWFVPSALWTTSFVQAKTLYQDGDPRFSIVLPVSFAKATGTVIRKIRIPSMDSDFASGSFLIESWLWGGCFGKIICSIVLQRDCQRILMSCLLCERELCAHVMSRWIYPRLWSQLWLCERDCVPMWCPHEYTLGCDHSCGKISVVAYWGILV